LGSSGPVGLVLEMIWLVTTRQRVFARAETCFGQNPADCFPSMPNWSDMRMPLRLHFSAALEPCAAVVRNSIDRI
jgi:hypothetical protein